ncbi:MAG: hypothetical protein ARM1_0116 [Candidatus Micrarchaeota archaeon]|nr:MAG: hypothetical protein ARM1_0116 [Candidatus Micrarchaeota archaeon]
MYTIVGIDPGDTIGVCIISLNGDLIRVAHFKYKDLSFLLNFISSYGQPVIVAVDKTHGNEMPKHIAAIFKAKFFVPSRDLSIETKKALSYSVKIYNPHERDAYAAALKAYRKYSNKLRQADKFAKQYSKDSQEIMYKVLNKFSIYEAINNKKANRK